MIPWIKTQAKKLLGKTENPYFKKLKRVLKHQSRIKEYTDIYYLGGFEYNEINNNRFNALTGSVSDFLSEVKYNTQSDNVEIYLIANGKTENYLLTLLDPVELYSSEEILNIFPSPNVKLEDFHFERIYPATRE